MAKLFGLMGKSMRDIGRITKWKVRDFSNGLMEEFIREIILMIKSMGLEEYGGLTVENIKASGREECNTVRVNIKEETVLGNRVVGSTVNVCVECE